MIKKSILFLFFVQVYSYDVLILAEPIIDRKCQIDHQTLKTLNLKKAESSPIGFDTLNHYISTYFNKDDITLAGSGFNIAKGLTKLDNDCAAIGTIGLDPCSNWIIEQTKKLNMGFIYDRVSIPTSQCLCFITPDKERTMTTYVGASSLSRLELINPKDFENLKFFHLEGYQVRSEKIAEAALRLAKKNKAMISIDLATAGLAKEKKEKFIYFIKNYANIVFCNEQEAKAISDMEDPLAACKYLASYCDIAIVTQGDKGGILRSNNETIYFSAIKTELVDTTGAGDFFTCGFIDAYLKGKSLEECLLEGRSIASQAVSIFGVEIPSKEWEFLKEDFR